MPGRIVEISNPLVSLSMLRGFMLVKIEGEEKSRIAFEDIDVLILNGSGATITTNLLNSLLEAGCMVVVLGKNYLPSGIFYPTNPHHLHKQKINLQIEATKPLQKRLWQAVVKAKILNQAAVISTFSGGEERQLTQLAKKVSSGDKENLEAQAARKYWQRLFGKNFRRNFDDAGINSLLNYGYAILRSAVARAIFAAGLHPAIGIHHSNQSNAFCLVDDLMEPFRPVVDFVVKTIVDKNGKIDELTPEIKKSLAKILNIDLSTSVGTTPLSNCLARLAQSFVRSLEEQKSVLDFPLSLNLTELHFEN